VEKKRRKKEEDNLEEKKKKTCKTKKEKKEKQNKNIRKVIVLSPHVLKYYLIKNKKSLNFEIRWVCFMAQ